ncbi:PREDICTED: uncharacterized protein LOC107188910 [Dufourea novaeangliae]|uniref:uncharacterized protein LOC107188910 n=1 Tax=Dufourea novaeangliae TaxID=178035 RepID=UPI0007675615|nr:PREDICTED: uncharacterized protein LOC107188910 [Dufourea novaeangliae]
MTMKMVQKCCVLGCPSSSDVPSQKFPSNVELLDRWWNNIKVFRKNPSSMEDLKKFQVCHLHFADNDYKIGGYKQRKLKDNVVPSLNLPVVSENITNIIMPIPTEPVHEMTIDLTAKTAKLFNIASRIRKQHVSVSRKLFSYKNRLRQAAKYQLKEKVTTMREMDNVCCLMWDEMLLQPHIDYDATIRGGHKGWKFPLANFSSYSQTNSERFIKCIKGMTKIIVDCGLIPVAYVCDQGKPNVSAINKLKFETYINTSEKLKYGKY